MNKRTTVSLPERLLLQAKRIAATEGRSLSSLIEEGLRKVTTEERAQTQSVSVPVSTAKGGFAPGITSLRDIAEFEDRDYVERLNSGFR
jgi:hypothetical protein